MKIGFRNTSIRLKLILMIGMATSLAVLILASTIIINEYITRKHQMEQHLSSLADMVSWNSSAALASKDYKSAGQALNSLKSQSGIVAAFLYSPEGELVSQYKTFYQTGNRLTGEQILKRVKEGGGDGLEPSESVFGKLWLGYKAVLGFSPKLAIKPEFSEIAWYDQYDQCHLFYPILIENEFAGVLHLVDNSSRLSGFFSNFYIIIWAIVLFALITLLLTSTRLQRMFSAPLLELVRAMTSAATEKKITVRVAKTGKDEFGQLIEIYNDMLTEIQNRDFMLDKQREELEFQVEARTEALSKRNTKLNQAVAEALAARDEAELANRAKSQFLAKMSHEIRTPMNSILGMTDVLSGSQLTSDQRHSIEVVQKSARLLLRVINDILDFSKIESGKFILEQHPFKCSEFVDECFVSLESQARSKGLGSRLVGSDLPDVLVGDAMRLSQILMNLIGNAVEYTASGEVILRVSSKNVADDNVRLLFEVIDTGIGIDEDTQLKIFDTISQTDGSMNKVLGGGGLGLAIAKQLVTLMRGDLGVISQLGKGTTFWFWVELKKLDAASPKSNIETHCKFSARVLVAEDYSANQLLTKRALEHLGCQVKVVTNGLEAVEELERNHYDLVLMDCQMPVMDGYQAATEIRRIESEKGVEKGIPIVALTAHALAGDKTKCLESGMDEWVTKPFTRHDIDQALQKWLPASLISKGEAPRSIAKQQSVVNEIWRQPTAIDLNFLQQNFNFDDPNDLEFIGTIKQAFQLNAEQTFNSLQVSIEKNEATQIRKLAHGLKSISVNVGATELSSRCKAMEQAGQQDKLQNAESLLAAMHFEYSRVLGELDRICQKK